MRWIPPGLVCLGVCVFVLTTACDAVATLPTVGSAQGVAAVPVSVRCGVARWPVKTLSDPDAGLIKLSSPVNTTIAELVQLRPPMITPNTARIAGVETTVYTLRADLKEMSEENDLDIHLVIADSTGQTMIAEFPSNDCQGVDHSTQRGAIGTARNALTQACGAPPTGKFNQLSGSATLTGVGFFDERHGQQGVAPNGIELHPVVAVAAITCTSTATNPHHPIAID